MLISPSSPQVLRATPTQAAPPPGTAGGQDEPPELYGALFQQQRDGTVKVLRYSGQTSPGTRPDIGEDAAPDGEVFISVNGIDQSWADHRQQITDWYHGGFESGLEVGHAEAPSGFESP